MDVELKFKPGVDAQRTALLREAGFVDSNCIRFFKDENDEAPLLQKLGGWQKLTPQHFRGTARGAHMWIDLSGIAYIGFGTEQSLEVYSSASNGIYDVTPITRSATLTNPLSTTIGQPNVTVADVGSNEIAGYFVDILNSVYVGGFALQGIYAVTAVANANQYSIQPGGNAAGTVAGGGTPYSFTTVNLSPNVQVSQGGRVFAQGEVIHVYYSTAVANFTLQGDYAIQIIGGTPYIVPGGNANAGATVAENGGNITIQYLIAPEYDLAAGGAYGAGGYGAGPYGIGGSVMQPLPRQWAIDNFGQYMVAAPLNGPLYQWLPPVTDGNVATAVSGAPQYSAAMFVAMPQEQVISVGSDAGGYQDPLLIRWSDVGNYSGSGAWTASATNQAGSYRNPSDGRWIAGLQAPQQAYLWSDVAFWSMNYIGFPLVYGFIQIANGCGIIGPRAAAYMNGRMLWAGPGGFWQYDGSMVSALPCAVWDFMYGKNGYDKAFAYSVFAAANTDFTEVAWFFAPIGANGLPTSYVKVNLSSGLWDKGMLTRTCWVDRSVVGAPMGWDGPSGLIQQHEVAIDNDGQAMNSWALTGYFKIDAGKSFVSINRLIPDFIYNGGKVLISVLLRNYPNDPPRTFGPFTATQATEFINTRCRGRLIQLKFDFSTLGTFARYGNMLAEVGKAGRR